LLPIHGHHLRADSFAELNGYGSDAPALRALMESDTELAKPLHPALPITAAQIVWAAREEMARTVEDALARRTRALFLNCAAAVAMAPRAAALLAHELHRDQPWQEDQIRQFNLLARNYSVR
jgi:glycerol-3-phosphate dehydrogenase